MAPPQQGVIRNQQFSTGDEGISGWTNKLQIWEDHFNDLKADMEGEMRRMHKFLDLPALSDDEWKNAVEHSTFAYMKKHPEVAVPPIAEQVFTGGGGNFINKGSNGRWAERLSAEDNEKYVAKAKAELGEECAEWLANGLSPGILEAFIRLDSPPAYVVAEIHLGESNEA